MAEQRYQAVMAVIGDGLTVSQAAEKTGVARQTLHRWLARYEAEGLDGLVDRSHRPVVCPHQMLAGVEVAVLELRRLRPYWGPRRLVFELAKRKVSPGVESAVYRALVRAGMIAPGVRIRRLRKWKRWERRCNGVVADGCRGRVRKLRATRQSVGGATSNRDRRCTVGQPYTLTMFTVTRPRIDAPQWKAPWRRRAY